MDELERYRRGTPPAFPESQPQYLQDELTKLENVVDNVIEITEQNTTDNQSLSASLKEAITVSAEGDKALAQKITELESTVTSGLGEVNAKIEEEVETLATADEALAQRITTLSASFKKGLEENTAYITQESEARVTAASSLSKQVLVLGATVDDNTASINEEKIVRATADSSLASSISSLSAQVSSNSSAITTEQTARANGDSALASSISTLSTTVGGHTTTISSHTSSINGIQAQYAVRINNNGKVSGFGLISNPSGVSDFNVEANTFNIYEPGTNNKKVYWDSGTSKLTVDGDIVARSFSGSGVVNTTNVATNAITVPQVSMASAGLVGNGSSQTALSVSITLPQSGYVLAMFSAKQGYISGGPVPWSASLYIGGNLVFSTDGSAGTTDSFSMSGAAQLAAGTHQVLVTWTGPSTMSINSRTLSVLPTMR